MIGYIITVLTIVSIFSYQQQLASVIADTVTDTESLDVTAVVPSPNAPGSGGSSGSPANPSNSVTISGFSFPDAKLTLLKDGQVATTLIANQDGTFTIVVNGLNFGLYQFAVFAEDRDGIASSSYVVNAPVYAAQNYAYTGVIIPPTISVSSTTLQMGEFVTVYGYAPPGATVLIEIPGRLTLGSTVADTSGFYRYEVRTSLLAGLYQFRTRAQIGAMQSMQSKPIDVTYFDGTNPPNPIPPQLAKCVDYSKDSRVNLVDFSILLFWFNKLNPPIDIDCNGDNTINIKDFSILMYFWTG